MKWMILGMIAFLSITSCGTTKEVAEVVVEKYPYNGLEKSLLWEVSGNGLTKISYVFGTIHIIDKDKFFFPNGTLKAIEAAESMVFEIDMKEMEDMSNMMDVLQKAFMKDDLKLKDLISEEDYAVVDAHFKKMGMPLMMFERVKPMFLSAFAGDMDPNALQSGEMKSYELVFSDLAQQINLDISGLETIDYQLSIFDSIPYIDQANMLVEGIKSGDAGGNQMEEMTNTYLSQDLDAMQKMFESEEGGLEGYEDILVFQRNKNWIPLMKERMIEKSHFFAVGAGHLGGELGVIHLLRKEGYEVRALSQTE